MTAEQTFKVGERVIHKSLGEGVFVAYEVYEDECVVEFTDELGYKDELRVTLGAVSKLKS